MGCACDRATRARMRNTAQRSVTTKWKGGADDAALLSNIVRFFSAPAALGLHRRAVSHRASAPLSVVYRTDLTNGTNSAPKHPLLPHETGNTQALIQHFSVNPPTRSAEIIQIFQKTPGATKYKMQCCRAETRRFLDANLPCVVFFLYICITNTQH